MRLMSVVAALVALVCVGIVDPAPVAAADLDRPRADNWKRVRTAKVRVHHHRHAHCHCEDPYAYQYSPRGYYPYYGSHYWVPTRVIQERKHYHYHHWNVQPPRFHYYPSWGYPKHWHHREWHRDHHGYHHRWHY